MAARILIATDLDAGPRASIERAIAPFMGPSTRLAICHVRDAPERHLRGRSRAEAADELDESARQSLEAWRAGLPAARDAELMIEAGTPYAGVASRAERWGADLVVVGAAGATGLLRVLLGSVAERVVCHAPCSVLVARDSPEQGVVLGATDLSDASFSAVSAAAEQALARGRPLVVAHVIVDLGSAPFSSASLAAPLHERRSGARAWIHHALGRVGAQGTADIAEGNAPRTIVRRAIELGAELVVVASHGGAGLSRLLLGSVSEEVARSAPCSVLVVRR